MAGLAEVAVILHGNIGFNQFSFACGQAAGFVQQDMCQLAPRRSKRICSFRFYEADGNTSASLFVLPLNSEPDPPVHQDNMKLNSPMHAGANSTSKRFPLLINCERIWRG